MRESTITFCLALTEWNFEEADVGTGAKRSRKRVQMLKVREISRSGGGDGVETEACSPIGNSSSDRKPVKMSEYWSDVNMWRCMGYKMGCTVLDPLKFADQGLRETSQERVATGNA